MLQQMRQAQAWMIKGVLWAVVLAFVVTIFYSWGVRSSRGPTRSDVATILGEHVGLQEFQSRQNRLYEVYRDIFRNQPDVDLRERFNFREMALEQIATRHLLLRMAQQNGLTVTDREVYDRIAAIPAFQAQGRFDSARYQALLRSQVPPVLPRQFEEEQRQELLLEKVQSLVQAAAVVTDAEMEQAYRQEHERVAVQYVTLLPSLFASQVQVTDEELHAYYETHQEDYREPEQRQIQYIAISPQRFRPTGEPPQDEIERYYASHQEAFRRQEQVRVRHILFTLPEDAPSEREAEVRAKAEQVLHALHDGADFAALAQANSDDTSTAEKGGDLGFFPRGQMVKPFEDVAFSLPVGQTSDLVRTAFGYHILRVEDKVAAGIKPLLEVQPEVIAAIQQEKTREATLAFVDDLTAALEDAPNQFTTLAEQHGLPVVTTPFVPATGQVADLEGVPDLVRRAFALTDPVGAVVGPDGTHYLFRVAASQPSSIAAFAVVETRVAEDLQRQKSSELARQAADDWLSKVQTGTPLHELAASLQVQVVTTELLKRQDPVPQLGQSPAFMQTVFGLQEGEAGVAHERARHFVIQATARQAADMEAYTTEKAAYREKLLERKRQQMLQAFQSYLYTEYQRLRQRGEIVVNPQYVF
jgi:peptidyl-prolyl cis-trans isomerase D